MKTLHNGYGNIVSFVDYVVGRHWGVYLPSPRPTYQRKEDNKSQMMTEEFYKQIARESAHMAVKSGKVS